LRAQAYSAESETALEYRTEVIAAWEPALKRRKASAAAWEADLKSSKSPSPATPKKTDNRPEKHCFSNGSAR
jgi:hypothetical protein